MLLPSIEATSKSDNNLFLEKFYIDIKDKEFIKAECDKYYKEQIYDLDKQIEIYNETIKKNLHILKEECEYEKKHKYPCLYSLDISRIKNNEKLIITNIKKIKDSEEINKNNTVRYYRNFYKYNINNCYIEISIDYDSINNVINLINNKILFINTITENNDSDINIFCVYAIIIGSKTYISNNGINLFDFPWFDKLTVFDLFYEILDIKYNCSKDLNLPLESLANVNLAQKRKIILAFIDDLTDFYLIKNNAIFLNSKNEVIFKIENSFKEEE